MAVASSTRYERVLSNLKSIKVDHYFNAIIGGDQIQHGKPAPDIFLKAVELLGVSKEDALVLEDSKNGILAAHAGNIPVICIPDLIHHSKDILDLTVGCYDSLDQLIDVIVKKMTKHNIEPVYNQDSRILILGSFPSVKSREAKFFLSSSSKSFLESFSCFISRRSSTNN